MVIGILAVKELKKAEFDINNGRNIEHYKWHEHPDIRALIARSDFAPPAYIIDDAPEVRLGLIQTNKWIDRIATREQNPILILEIIKSGCILNRWRRSHDESIQKAIANIEGDDG
ncbi:hypothetical protein [Enterovibrio norvegicus]|uniref:hypothetical protein n=1 Tax=Enterovibrio norvegicus TaxID=188144 RepID=UPI000C82DB05|nr:hypothetical protein [Enterovibrio norvegicus]PMH64532.1 hypothetical protein BCU62_15875 [Enterovibrio norvegicus]